MDKEALEATAELLAPIETISAAGGNTLIVGGITLKRPSGGRTIANPLVVYDNITNEHVMEFWKFLATNKAAQEAQSAFNEAMAAELIKWGAERDGLTTDDGNVSEEQATS